MIRRKPRRRGQKGKPRKTDLVPKRRSSAGAKKRQCGADRPLPTKAILDRLEKYHNMGFFSSDEIAEARKIFAGDDEEAKRRWLGVEPSTGKIHSKAAARSSGPVESRAIEGDRAIRKLQGKTLLYIDRCSEVLDELRADWPLTVRQLYYQLVARGLIKNTNNDYRRLSHNMVLARLQDLVPWEAIEDRTRGLLSSAGWPDANAFRDEQLGGFMSGYRRDLLQSQSGALEIWVEKDALSTIIHSVALKYCVPVVPARGFASLSALHNLAERVSLNGTRQMLILYFSDLDPSGEEMLPAILHTLQVEMTLGGLVEGIRCALTPEQVDKFSLPPAPVKRSDSRARKFTVKHGSGAGVVELDALPPRELRQIVRASIESQLDIGRFKKEQQREAEEKTRIEQMRDHVLEAAEGVDL